MGSNPSSQTRTKKSRLSESPLESSSFYVTRLPLGRGISVLSIWPLALGLLVASILAFETPQLLRAHETDVTSSRFDTSLFSTSIFARLAGRPTFLIPATRVVAYNAADPPPPLDLRVEDQGVGGQLIVHWKLPSGIPVEHVRIYRSLERGAFGRIGEVDALETFVDRGLENGQTYTYTVRSVLGSAESTVGPMATDSSHDLTPPAAPEDVRIETGPGLERIVLTWRNPDDSDFAGGRIYRSDTPGALGLRIADGVSESRFVDESAPLGIPLFYTVTSVDVSGNESLPPLPPVPIGRSNPFSLP